MRHIANKLIQLRTEEQTEGVNYDVVFNSPKSIWVIILYIGITDYLSAGAAYSAICQENGECFMQFSFSLNVRREMAGLAYLGST
jgi:hypothetical protein